MNSLFPTEERPSQPVFYRVEIPDEVRRNFGLLLDWFTPNTYLSWIILGLNILVFVMMLLSGFNPDKLSSRALLIWGADYGPLTVTRGEWWRMLTSCFVHLGITHLAFNMIVLYQIGPFMERLLGSIAFLIVYFVAGLAGAACSLAFSPYLISAGASGAIFGLYGALIGFLILRRDSIPAPALKTVLTSAVIFLIYNGVYGVLRTGVDLAAHIGGLIAGFLCGLAISTPIDAGFRHRRLVRATAAGVVSLVVLAALTTQLPRPLDLQDAFSQFRKTEARVLNAYRAILQQWRTGKQEDLASQLETQVIGPWQAERDSLARLTGLPRTQQRVVSSFVAYMDARQQGWTNLVRGLRTNNSQLVKLGLAQQKQAQDHLKGDLGG